MLSYVIHPATNVSPLGCCLTLILGLTGESGLKRAGQMWTGHEERDPPACDLETPEPGLLVGQTSLCLVASFASLEPHLDSLHLTGNT